MTGSVHRILVVDDLPDWCATLSGLLVDEGYEVQVADSSAKAVRLLQTGQFDLAVLDVRLDETDEDNTEGLDLAAQIKRRWPAVKVIVITGVGTQDTMERAMGSDSPGESLVEDYLPKTQAEQLPEFVSRVLAQ
jgi:CheY-like chemotaxis protein